MVGKSVGWTRLFFVSYTPLLFDVKMPSLLAQPTSRTTVCWSLWAHAPFMIQKPRGTMPNACRHSFWGIPYIHRCRAGKDSGSGARKLKVCGIILPFENGEQFVVWSLPPGSWSFVSHSRHQVLREEMKDDLLIFMRRLTTQSHPGPRNSEYCQHSSKNLQMFSFSNSTMFFKTSKLWSIPTLSLLKAQDLLGEAPHRRGLARPHQRPDAHRHRGRAPRPGLGPSGAAGCAGGWAAHRGGVLGSRGGVPSVKDGGRLVFGKDLV